MLLSVSAPAALAKPAKPLLAVSTSMLELALHDLFGEKISLYGITPPGACPGHYDLKPEDLAALAGARVIILHEFQSGMKEKLERAGFAPGSILVIPDRGSFVTPPGYTFLLEYLASRVPAFLPELAAEAEAGRKNALARVEKARKEAEKEADRLRGRVVVTAYFQKDFVTYFGLTPAAVIPAGELSMRQLNEIVKAGRAAGAEAVVGNRQSGEKSFTAVAEMLGVPVITLSNFPDKRSGGLDYREFLLSNVRALEDGFDQ